MDATTAAGEKAAPPVPAGSDTGAALSPSPRAELQTPMSHGAAATALVEPAAAGAGSGGGRGEEDDDDDEQVERFYALLANIRAMRGAFLAGGDKDGGEATAGNGARKAAEGAEPPWRPAFGLEDFVEEATTKRWKDALPSPSLGKQQQADTGPSSRSSRRVAAAGRGRTALPQ